MHKNLISIIIVSYNTEALTLQAVSSVINETKNYQFELIIFDNDSNDGTFEGLSAKYGNQDNIKIIQSKTNYGFAKGNNIAINSYAKGEYILLLNPDTIVLNSAIDKLMDFAIRNPKAGVWGGKTFFPDMRVNPTYCWNRQSFWSLLCQVWGLNSIFRRSSIFNPEAIGYWNTEKEIHVDIVSGCFLLIKNKTWKTLKGFDELFFMYGEEADLCLRAKKIGFTPMITTDASIIHYGGASEKNKSEKLIKLINAKALLIEKHFKNKTTKKIALVLLKLWPLTRSLAHYFFLKLGYKNKYHEWRKVLEGLKDSRTVY